jgi:tetratricopeptide (TPR) repeat protein
LARIQQNRYEDTMLGYTDAVESYTRLREILIAHPPSAASQDIFVSYFFEGLLYLKGGDYDLAVDALERFREAMPDSPNIAAAHNALGIAHYYRDEYDTAVLDFRRALAANPDLAEARFNLRSVFTRLSTYDEALALQRTGKADQALERVDKLKEFAPRFLPARRLEIALLRQLGRDVEALAVGAEVLGADANHPLSYPVRTELARIRIQRGEKDIARSLLMDNLTRFPSYPDETAFRDVVFLMATLGNP